MKNKVVIVIAAALLLSSGSMLAVSFNAIEYSENTLSLTNVHTIGEMVYLPGGEFDMGDHIGDGAEDPSHPNDEVPVHTVYLDAFSIGAIEVTNQEYCDYLNSALYQGTIEVRDGFVYATGGSVILCETREAVSYSHIEWDGNIFTVIDGKEDHPMIGVRWYGAATFCNWLSIQQGYQELYDTSTWTCDLSNTGYRLPTEAEWEYAARGGEHDPYYNFPWGNDADNTKANWPNSGDPYEAGSQPWTTPVGFYNGELHYKSDFNWPSDMNSYQTSDGGNGYGLYDVAGNVWEWCNDWYDKDYYQYCEEQGIVNNPPGPDNGGIMPDGNPYHVVRGGNWYNGEYGHSRVSNRNNGHYRGPDDPNHAWYHIGFRIVLKADMQDNHAPQTPD